MGGISIPSLLIILLLVVLLFGTKKLKNLGGDLGGAVKGFKKAISDSEDADFPKDKQISEKSAESADVKENEKAKSE